MDEDSLVQNFGGLRTGYKESGPFETDSFVVLLSDFPVLTYPVVPFLM